MIGLGETVRTELIGCGCARDDAVSVIGWLFGTLVCGQPVMWQGELVWPGPGEAVVFKETLGPHAD